MFVFGPGLWIHADAKIIDREGMRRKSNYKNEKTAIPEKAGREPIATNDIVILNFPVSAVDPRAPITSYLKNGIATG